ncbi:MAG: RsbRD N-terminal domain-containing protein [Candidatus Zixiibacteriota bacterium]
MLKELLKQKRAKILAEWIEEAYKSYPAETVKIFGKSGDPFQNPVGFTISDALNQMYDSIIKEEMELTIPTLEKMIRIRSIQDFSPSQAVSFVFSLREIVHKNFKSENKDNNLTNELIEFNKEIDKLALIIFDSYMTSREKINELKINQAKIGSLKIADRVNKRLEEQANKNEDN